MMKMVKKNRFLTNGHLTSIILGSNKDKGNEKEEYIRRLHREKHPWLKDDLLIDLWKVAFEPNR